jgi:hypothetical protein
LERGEQGHSFGCISSSFTNKLKIFWWFYWKYQ